MLPGFALVLFACCSAGNADEFFWLSAPPIPVLDGLPGQKEPPQWSDPVFSFDQQTAKFVLRNARTRSGVLFSLNIGAGSITQYVKEVVSSNCLVVGNNSAEPGKSTVCMTDFDYRQLPECGMWQLLCNDGQTLVGPITTNPISGRGSLHYSMELIPPDSWSNGWNEQYYLVPQEYLRGFPSNATGKLTIQGECVFETPHWEGVRLLGQFVKSGPITNGVPSGGRWTAITRSFSNLDSRKGHGVSEAWYDDGLNLIYYGEWSCNEKGKIFEAKYREEESSFAAEWDTVGLKSIRLYSVRDTCYPVMQFTRNASNGTFKAFICYTEFITAFSFVPQPTDDSRVPKVNAGTNAWHWLVDWRTNGGAFPARNMRPKYP
ncbi:MAG: hypothetical protein C0404_06610 [Verrucomicrobia bacterium]|nr:hypothetical protein [Verrucomicrobiota bacterium]